MEEKKQVTVYIAAHKAFKKPEEGYLRTLQTGLKGTPPLENSLNHQSGDSMAEWSEHMCELTALYWIWKNTSEPYAGLCHYRRYFGEYRTVNGRPTKTKQILSGPHLEKLLGTGRVLIVAEKGSYWPFSVARHYAFSHEQSDLAAMRSILAEEFSDYLPAFDKVMGGHVVHLYNMFIAARPVMEEYCQWLFRVLAVAIERKLHVNKVGREKRIYGFLAERLLNVWIERNRSTFALHECPVVETEPRSSYERRFDVARRISSYYARNLFAPSRALR